MATHTARLIFTIIFLVLAVSGLVSGFWFSALFWALIAMAVGYPFVRGGRLNLNYNDSPALFVLEPSGAASPSGMPPGYEAMMAQPVM